MLTSARCSNEMMRSLPGLRHSHIIESCRAPACNSHRCRCAYGGTTPSTRTPSASALDSSNTRASTMRRHRQLGQPLHDGCSLCNKTFNVSEAFQLYKQLVRSQQYWQQQGWSSAGRLPRRHCCSPASWALHWPLLPGRGCPVPRDISELVQKYTRGNMGLLEVKGVLFWCRQNACCTRASAAPAMLDQLDLARLHLRHSLWRTLPLDLFVRASTA